MRGDISNTIVHPAPTPTTIGLGVNFHAGLDPHTTVRLRTKYGQLAFERLAEINKGNDTSLKVCAFLYVAASNLYGRWLKMAREYLTKARIVLNTAKLRFIPDTGRPPELTEDVHERLATLAGYLLRALLVFGRGRIRAKNGGPNQEGVPTRAPGQDPFPHSP